MTPPPGNDFHPATNHELSDIDSKIGSAPKPSASGAVITAPYNGVRRRFHRAAR